MSKPEWMSEELKKNIGEAVAFIDRAVEMLENAIDELAEIDNDEAEDMWEALRWDYKDELEDKSCELYRMIDDEE